MDGNKKRILVMDDGWEVEVSNDLRELYSRRWRDVFIPSTVIPQEATLVPFRDNVIFKFIEKEDGELGWLLSFAHQGFESVPDGATPVQYRADTRDETSYQKSIDRLREQELWLRQSMATEECKT